ncbi:putative zinc metalloprotease aq_1964 [Aplysia californica]|uniref:Zinc metalloprotease aq_1964 n=1 Tax=Aplysia californica TaxID=6500 RepID=A0ABM0ZUY0_APLCA|nr:putative zinc metalloprotease aq_1964 [Aplysia californica]
MPLRFLQKWPQTLGFDIFGRGPSYVVSVEKGTPAYKAGLMPGDQILELNGRDVTDMSADQIKVLAKSSHTKSPELEVVSCLQTIIMEPDVPIGYGFNVLNEKPLRVGAVSYEGPAYGVGLRAGDVILEVNSRSSVSAEAIGAILSKCHGKLTLLIIPMGRASNLIQVDKTLSKIPSPDPRLHKARALHTRVGYLE